MYLASPTFHGLGRQMHHQSSSVVEVGYQFLSGFSSCTFSSTIRFKRSNIASISLFHLHCIPF